MAIAIDVEDVSKRYRIGLQEQQKDNFGEVIVSWVKSPFSNFRKVRSLNKFDDDSAADVFWALRDINFQVNVGDTIGIIGKNGAGKSTLLKILSGITEPTKGKISLYGRTASLLEVGTGFNDELTGRENAYLNAALLGMSKREIDLKFDEILDFAGVEKFIDTPVKRYSSGMKVRLAFAVAAHLDPEILIIDEVLAVGDHEFQKKCLGKMSEVAKDGRTVIFVSHDMAAVNNLCSRALMLTNGQVTNIGETKNVIADYLTDAVSTSHSYYEIPESQDRVINHEGFFRFTGISIWNTREEPTNSFFYHEPITIKIRAKVLQPIDNATMMLVFGSMLYEQVGVISTQDQSSELIQMENGDVEIIIKTQQSFLPGEYNVLISMMDGNGWTYDKVPNVIGFSVINSSIDGKQKYSWRKKFGVVNFNSKWEFSSIS